MIAKITEDRRVGFQWAPLDVELAGDLCERMITGQETLQHLDHQWPFLRQQEIRARGIDPKFLFFALREPETKERIRRTSSRTVNIANISLKNLQPTVLRIPLLAEQRRIVSKIESLQERSSRARRALSEVGPLLAQFRRSVLRAAHPDIEPATELLGRIRTERRQWSLLERRHAGHLSVREWVAKIPSPRPSRSIEQLNCRRMPSL